MLNKTEILCNVQSCVYYKENHCAAETITVSCNNCIMPNVCQETECKSFRRKEIK